jgi:hypothetical protein
VVVHDHQGHCHLSRIVVAQPLCAYTVNHTIALVLVVGDADKIRAALCKLLEKPGHEFEPEELLARIETALRHAATGEPPPQDRRGVT